MLQPLPAELAQPGLAQSSLGQPGAASGAGLPGDWLDTWRHAQREARRHAPDGALAGCPDGVAATAPPPVLAAFAPASAPTAPWGAPSGAELPGGAGAPGHPLPPSRPESGLRPRVHAEWSADGVRVWIGAPRGSLPEPVALTEPLRTRLERQGTRLLRLVCNGTALWSAGTGAAPVADAPSRPDPPPADSPPHPAVDPVLPRTPDPASRRAVPPQSVNSEGASPWPTP